MNPDIRYAGPLADTLPCLCRLDDMATSAPLRRENPFALSAARQRVEYGHRQLGYRQQMLLGLGLRNAPGSPTGIDIVPAHRQQLAFTSAEHQRQREISA